jgi:hypothetical protein
MRDGDALRHHQAPGARARRCRQEEPVRLGGDEGGSLLLREGEAQRALIAAERERDDPEREPIPEHVLLGTRQRPRDRPHIGYRDHSPMMAGRSDSLGARRSALGRVT